MKTSKDENVIEDTKDLKEPSLLHVRVKKRNIFFQYDSFHNERKEIIIIVGVWITKTIAEDGPREAFLHVTLTETLEFALLLIIITISTKKKYAFYANNSFFFIVRFLVVIGSVSSSMFYLTNVMKRVFMETEFETVNERDIVYEDIKNAADFWVVS